MKRPRVAVVMTGIFPEQLVLWQACNSSSAAITIIGTETNIYSGRWPWRPRLPSDLETILLRPIMPTPLLARGGPVLWFYRGLGQALRRARPDLIHVLSEPWGGLVIQALSARWLSRLSIPICVHGADNMYWHGLRGERYVRRLILERTLPRVNGFGSWSQEGIEVAREAGLGEVPTAVVPAIIPDPQQFSPPSAAIRRELRTKLDLPVDGPVVGFVGRLVEEKGISDLILAFRDIGDPIPFLGIWGAGELLAAVKQRMHTERINGRVFGPVGLDEVRTVYQACDVIVVPSRATASWKEQFGRVALEAMLAGCVIVAYRSGALPEVLGDAGILVEEGDIVGLRSAIQGVIANPHELARLAKRGRQSALERYHPAIRSDRMSSLWEEVLCR